MVRKNGWQQSFLFYKKVWIKSKNERSVIQWNRKSNKSVNFRIVALKVKLNFARCFLQCANLSFLRDSKVKVWEKIRTQAGAVIRF